MNDIWFINASIPLKDKPLVELVRGVVLWCIWLERNKLCFQQSHMTTFKALGSKIIALATFWCKTLNNGLLLNLSLIMPYIFLLLLSKL